jgi:ferredoxin
LEQNTLLITVADQQSFPHSKDHSLLESIEQSKVDIQSHCREGFCGACRTKLVSGEVEYTTDPLAYIDDDEILPCCCVPISDITIIIS